ncbi:MAG: hypothetical protein AB3N20_13665 [Rhizobiaceae bacterium]
MNRVETLWLLSAQAGSALGESEDIAVDPQAYQQTLDTLFGYIILAICIVSVLGVLLGFGSITVRSGNSRSSRGGGSGGGGSSGGGGASGSW